MTGVKKATAGAIFFAACLERTFVDLPQFDFLDSPRAKARRQTISSALKPASSPAASASRVASVKEFRDCPRPLQARRQVASRELPSKDEARLSVPHACA